MTENVSRVRARVHLKSAEARRAERLQAESEAKLQRARERVALLSVRVAARTMQLEAVTSALAATHATYDFTESDVLHKRTQRFPTGLLYQQLHQALLPHDRAAGGGERGGGGEGAAADAHRGGAAGERGGGRGKVALCEAHPVQAAALHRAAQGSCSPSPACGRCAPRSPPGPPTTGGTSRRRQRWTRRTT